MERREKERRKREKKNIACFFFILKAFQSFYHKKNKIKLQLNFKMYFLNIQNLDV